MKLREKTMNVVFAVTAVIFILAVILICAFIFVNGVPAIAEIGIFRFLLGSEWKPQDMPASYGILPMILGSVYVTAGAILVGVPTGVLTAVFMARFCGKRLHRVLKPFVDILAGIPSVVYGFFGLTVIVPAIRNTFGGAGTSLLAASLLLGIMILPTVIAVSENAIRQANHGYYEGALALGATHERSVFLCEVPAARSGIMAGIILGIGRAVGETMAVILVAGNQPQFPGSIFEGVRTLTANIVLELGDAADLHRGALIGTAVVLFVFILMINLLAACLKRKKA